MTRLVFVPHGMITIPEVDFTCPECGHSYGEQDWYKKLDKAPTAHIYIICKGCKKKIGVSTDFKGDVQIWMKHTEKGIHPINWKELP